MMQKRWIQAVALVVCVAALAVAVRSDAPGPPLGEPGTNRVVAPFLLDLQERTFRFFWDTANPANGLVPDRYPSTSISSIASVGFALTTYSIGVERAYVTREAARRRVLDDTALPGQRTAGCRTPAAWRATTASSITSWT